MRRAILTVLLWALPPLPAQQSGDRAAAEWVLRANGRVRIASQTGILSHIRELPESPFRLEAVDLIGTIVEPSEFSKLSQCTELRELLLPGPSFNPGAGSRLDANDEFRHLAGLRNLEKLHFSLHFLTNINVQDKGIALLKNLTGLKELRLTQSRVKGSSLAAFVNLERLDLNYSSFDDDGMKQLAGLKKLKVLYLRDTLITDRGMAHLASLNELEELDLYGAPLSDASIRVLAGAKKLRRLNLLGSRITDESAETLAALPLLEDLNLYRTGVGNSALSRLQQRKSLRNLDLRYTRVSRGGVEAFRKALPQSRIQFQDTTPETAPPALRDSRPTSSSANAIAEWVRKLGGRAEFAEGALREIDLSRTPVTDAQLSYLGSLASLKKLNLESTEAGDLGMSAVARLAGLEQINLSHTLVTDKGLAALAPLSKLRRLWINNNTHLTGKGLPLLPELEELELSGTSLDDAGLERAARIPGLRALRAAYSNISDTGLKHLAALPQLRSLDLTSTDILDAGLAALKPLVTLEELFLSYGRFSDKGIASLASLSSLRRLDIARTRLSDAGLAAIAKLTSLRRLNLDYSNISDQGLELLAGALPELEELRLDTANITDKGLEPLQRLKRLRYVNLYHTMVTDQGYQALKKHLPGCQVVYERESSLPNRRKS
jgi:Leucine-rich repeat (LRR) protein